ncbi:MAG TPA: 2TM domain-containing protein [Micromonosporaceae bacterium]
MAINDTDQAARDAAARETVVREQALKQLKKRRDFYGHLLVYALVNGFFVVLWAMIDVHVFFWPIFPIVGWGIGLALNAWDVFRRDQFTEEQIQREIDRLRS